MLNDLLNFKNDKQLTLWGPNAVSMTLYCHENERLFWGKWAIIYLSFLIFYLIFFYLKDDEKIFLRRLKRKIITLKKLPAKTPQSCKSLCAGRYRCRSSRDAMMRCAYKYTTTYSILYGWWSIWMTMNDEQ